MIVAIVDCRIVAFADTVTECAERVAASPFSQSWVRYRPASPALQDALESQSFIGPITIRETADLAEGDEDIRRIREHVLAKAIDNASKP